MCYNSNPKKITATSTNFRAIEIEIVFFLYIMVYYTISGWSFEQWIDVYCSAKCIVWWNKVQFAEQLQKIGHSERKLNKVFRSHVNVVLNIFFTEKQFSYYPNYSNLPSIFCFFCAMRNKTATAFLLLPNWNSSIQSEAVIIAWSSSELSCHILVSYGVV